MSQTLYLLDGHNFIYRALHAAPPLTTSSGFPTGGLSLFATMLVGVLRRFEPEHIGVIFDADGGSFRHELYPLYKANRSKHPEHFVQQMPHFGSICDALGLPQLTVPGFEADDVLATLARLAPAQGYDVVLLSTDKDLAQCLTSRVSMWDISKREMGGVELAHAKFGVAPRLVPDVQALCGDKADNIPGAPGVGIVTASSLVRRWGSLEGVLANVDQVSGPKRRAAIRDHAEQLRLYRQLTELRADVDVAFVHEEWRWRGVDAQALEEIVERFELGRLRHQARGLPAASSDAEQLFSALGKAPLEERVTIALDAVERGSASMHYDRPGGGLGRTELAFADGSVVVLRPLQARHEGRSLRVRWDIDQAYRRGRLKGASQ